MFSTQIKRRIFVLSIALSLPGLFAWQVNSQDSQSQENFAFTILHSNDLHSHEDSYLEHGKNIGGLPRIAHLIKVAKKKSDKVLAVDAGDLFQGTAYFEEYKGESDVECLNKAGYDIYTLGNHDFDEGSENLGKQMKLARFDVICSNLDVSSEPNLSKVVKHSVVKNIGGQKVAFIGVITPALKQLAPRLDGVKLLATDKEWTKPVEAEIAKAREEGINKIILVSHCGVEPEKELAALDDVDLVIGGHSHTRLDKAIVVDHKDGSRTMLVQTGCYGRALGRLDLVFDKDGKLLLPESQYRLINITDRIFEEPDLKAYVTEKGKPFEYLKKPLVMAELNFDNRFSRYSNDSPMGDLICDALFDAGIEDGATITLQNRGGIRGGFEQGPITIGRVREVLPFQNKLIISTVSGSTLLRALEHSVSAKGGTGGQFFDVHGLKFAWDPSLPAGKRIVFAYAQNKEGAYEKIEAADLYRIGVNDYTFKGGEGYDFKDARDIKDTGLRLSTVMENYLKKKEKISPALPSRFLKVSSNLAQRKTEDGEEIIHVSYPSPGADLYVLQGSGEGVSFMSKLGVLPLENPQLKASKKTDSEGKLTLSVSELMPPAKSKTEKSKGENLFVSVLLKAREKDGSSISLVSPPFKIR